jgi:hypothetical protein
MIVEMDEVSHYYCCGGLDWKYILEERATPPHDHHASYRQTEAQKLNLQYKFSKDKNRR